MILVEGTFVTRYFIKVVIRVGWFRSDRNWFSCLHTLQWSAWFGWNKPKASAFGFCLVRNLWKKDFYYWGHIMSVCFMCLLLRHFHCKLTSTDFSPSLFLCVLCLLIMSLSIMKLTKTTKKQILKRKADQSQKQFPVWGRVYSISMSAIIDMIPCCQSVGKNGWF